MTQDFGDFANINVDEAVNRAKRQAEQVAQMQDKLSEAVGRAESQDGYVKVTYTSAAGIAELEINPRAMRMASADLAETIKSTVKDAAADLQANIRAMMADIYAGQPNNPLDIMQDPSKMTERLEEMKGLLDSAMGDASLYMEKLRRRIQT